MNGNSDTGDDNNSSKPRDKKPSKPKSNKAKDDKSEEAKDDLTYSSSLSQSFVHFNPKETAVLGLTAMIKVLAQMKNLRRGHEAQGKLKRINIDQTYEGYANFMAPMRMKKIRYDVEHPPKDEKTKKDLYSPDDLAKIFDTRVLKPSTDTFLTPEWDEMVPFPTSKLSPPPSAPLFPTTLSFCYPPPPTPQPYNLVP